MIVHLSRVIYREKHPYLNKYSSYTRYIVEVNGKRATYGVGFFKNYKEFISKMKERFGEGENIEYNIDQSKPYTLYL